MKGIINWIVNLISASLVVMTAEYFERPWATDPKSALIVGFCLWIAANQLDMMKEKPE